MARGHGGGPRMAREKRTIKMMVEMYCFDHHAPKEGLCRHCNDLLGYAGQRLDRCPFGEEKPACAKCAVHCYSPSMRARVTSVMRYAGPRVIAKHPVLALLHGIQDR